jgi:hypothetical protein
MVNPLVKVLVLSSIVLGLTGCGQTTRSIYNEWYNANINPDGFTSYDPPNGDWIFIPNESAGAYLERTQDWTIDKVKDGQFPNY